MNNFIENVDICIGLCWGDEGKGKIVSQLIKNNYYNFVCRWSGSSNAGHTIYIDKLKYSTHIVPAGIFYNVPSIIGPDCYINETEFKKELDYLLKHGYNINLVKVSPRAHVITEEHINEDKLNKKNNNSTGKGVAFCAADKFKRKGILVKDYDCELFKNHIWDEKLYGNILCEGAQGAWLDINYGNYPFVTSSSTLPYSACSLGFPTQKIRYIYGAAKIYDTRVGTDPEFDKDNYDRDILDSLALLGNEFGTTTGRPRKVKWLNIDKLVYAINLTGTTHIIISKIDIIEKLNEFKIFIDNKYLTFHKLNALLTVIENHLLTNCNLLKSIIFSDNPYSF